MLSSNIKREIEKFKVELDRLKPAIPTIGSSPSEPYAKINGKEFLIFCSNNYLGLANADFVKDAVTRAIKKYGFGSAGSRWASGTTDLHCELERKLANFKAKEDAITFSAGFMTNSGAIPALTESLIGEKPFPTAKASIFSDALNHASIIDGCRNSRAKVYVYKHKNTEHLADLLKQSKEDYKLIVTDGVFSMDGDIAPLDQIVKLAEEYKAMVMVDEAHAIGILGKHGRGTTEHFNLEDKIEISMGTLSKTFGALGGYIAGDKSVIDYLRCSARTYIFSAAMPACNAAVVSAILKVISTDQSYRNKVVELADYLRSGLKNMGLSTLASETAIIPIFVGSESRAIELSKKMFKHGIYLTCAVWPAVEKKQARLRATVTASHSKEQIDKFLNILDNCLKNIKI